MDPSIIGIKTYAKPEPWLSRRLAYGDLDISVMEQVFNKSVYVLRPSFDYSCIVRPSFFSLLLFVHFGIKMISKYVIVKSHDPENNSNISTLGLGITSKLITAWTSFFAKFISQFFHHHTLLWLTFSLKWIALKLRSACHSLNLMWRSIVPIVLLFIQAKKKKQQQVLQRSCSRLNWFARMYINIHQVGFCWRINTTGKDILSINKTSSYIKKSH